MSRYIDDWVQRLSLSNVAFGGMPACPYAAKAKWQAYESDAPVREALIEGAQLLTHSNWDALIYLVPDTADEVLDPIVNFTQWPDIVAMLSHPNDPMFIGGYRTTQHERRVYVIQSKAALAAARQKLKDTDYYKNWTPSQLNRVGL